MTKEEFKEYKKQKERERRMKMSEEKKNEIRFKDKEAKRGEKASMTDSEKAAFDGLAKDRSNSKIPEEVQYDRIADRIRKKAAKGEDNNEEDNHKELLEWVEYYKHNADSKKTLKRRSLDMFRRCEEFVREAVKEDTKSDDDEEEENW